MELHTRERLTGAVILVALVVLLVPELLSGPKHAARPAAEVERTSLDARPPAGPVADAHGAALEPSGADQAPPAKAQAGAHSAESERSATAAEEAPIQSYTLPLGDEPRSAALGEPGVAADVPPRSMSGDEAGPPAPPRPEATAGKATGADGAGAKAAGPKAPAAETAGGKATRAETGAANVPAGRAGRTMHAEPARAAPLQADSGAAPPGDAQKARKPAAATPAAESERPHASHAGARGWTVQVGSFGSRENADRLVHQLKLKGYGAFVSETTSHGHKWYRVRVGPERDRAEASTVAARLRAAGHAGAMVPP